MTGLAILVLAAGLAIFVWHLVRPNVRDLRISMARFLPDLQPSQAPRYRISPVPPMTSLPFLLRMLVLALVILAIWPQLLPQVAPAAPAAHLRIVLDRSPSNRIADRELQSLRAVARLIEHSGTLAEVCVDVVVVDGAAEFLVRGDPAEALAVAPASGAGMTAAALLRPLMRAIQGPCTGLPTHAAVVTDLPPMPVPEGLFSGPLVWWQVGDPVPNLALSDVRVTGGGLSGVEPGIEVSVQAFGWTGAAPSVAMETRQGRRQIALRPDPTRGNGWIGQIPFPGAGEQEVALIGDDGFAGDNRLRFVLRDAERLAVDWRLTNLPRPAVLTEGGPGDLLVDALDPSRPVPEDRPVVLVYPTAFGTQPAQIGYFRHRHPVLEGINFDVLEPLLPGGLMRLPAGFLPVLRQDAAGAPVLVAVREAPRGVILPAPDVAGQGREVSLVLFANAIRWASDDPGEPVPGQQHRDAGGATIVDALLESDTGRPLAPVPDLARLADAPGDATPAEPMGISAWLLVAALLVFLTERAVGVFWRAER